jgi:hypothetical protein
MAWWNTQLIFKDDTLIAEGINPVALDDIELVIQEEEPEHDTELYTRVIVSGYALYGKLRGYYALGVAHWRLDRLDRRAFMREASQRNCEPVSDLTPIQRAAVRECLMQLSPEAWETSSLSFRKSLET